MALSYGDNFYDSGPYGGFYLPMATESVVQQRGVEYTDTADIPRWAIQSSGASPAYPAQTRTYTVQTRNWDQIADPSGAGFQATLASWTRTELHN